MLNKNKGFSVLWVYGFLAVIIFVAILVLKYDFKDRQVATTAVASTSTPAGTICFQTWLMQDVSSTTSRALIDDVRVAFATLDTHNVKGFDPRQNFENAVDACKVDANCWQTVNGLILSGIKSDYEDPFIAPAGSCAYETQKSDVATFKSTAEEYVRTH